MGTYNLPRSVKGEGRILFIFTGKSLIYSAVVGGIGLIFYFIFSALKLNMIGIVITKSQIVLIRLRLFVRRRSKFDV